MEKPEPSELSPEIERLFDGASDNGAARLFMEVWAKAKLQDVQVYEFRNPILDLPGKIATANQNWTAYEEKLAKAVRSEIEKSIYDIKLFDVFDANPVFLLQFYEDEYAEPIQIRIDISDNKAVSSLDDMIGKLKEKKRVRIKSTPAKKPLALRPRWAEENRPKKQIKLRLLPETIEELDEAAATDDVSRNDWIEGAIRTALDQRRPR